MIQIFGFIIPLPGDFLPTRRWPRALWDMNINAETTLPMPSL